MAPNPVRAAVAESVCCQLGTHQTYSIGVHATTATGVNGRAASIYKEGFIIRAYIQKVPKVCAGGGICP